jgi:hypothetical protein
MHNIDFTGCFCLQAELSAAASGGVRVRDLRCGRRDADRVQDLSAPAGGFLQPIAYGDAAVQLSNTLGLTDWVCLAQVFVVHVNRAGRAGDRIDTSVDFHDSIDLRDLLISPEVAIDYDMDRCKSTYTLQGVCFHQGVSANSGHYFALVKSPPPPSPRSSGGGGSLSDKQPVEEGEEAEVAAAEASAAAAAAEDEDEDEWVELNDSWCEVCKTAPQKIECMPQQPRTSLLFYLRDE